MSLKTSAIRLYSILGAILMIAAIAVGQQEYRQWEPPDGVSVRQGWHIEWFRGGESRDAGQNAGEVAFVWSDTRDGDRGVYMQVIGTDGNYKFGEGGLMVADAPGRQEDPGVWPDPDGGWFVAWEDFDMWREDGQTYGDSLGDIYITKISADGRRLWSVDDPRGAPVIIYPGIQEDVRIVHDGQGGCIIAWRDMRGGDVGDLYAQHILSDGRRDPDWPENGLPIVVAPGAQTSHTADVDGAGGMIIAWRDGRVGGDNNIWAQRITPSGDLLWGEGRGIIVNNNEANQEAPKLCPDGAGGVFITWIDDRNARETGKDVYIQRISTNGELMWSGPGEGVALCNEVGDQTGNRIIVSDAGTAIVLWEDKRINRDEADLFAMRIGGSNSLTRLWEPAQGKPVCIADRQQQESRLYPDGQGGAYFVWEDERDGGFPEIDIWAQRLTRDGNPVWAENGIPICRVPGNMNSPLVRRTADGGMAVAWADLRSGSVNIYSQRVLPNGTAVWDQNGRPIAAGIGGNATRPNVFTRGNNDFTLFWLDGRYGARGTIPFIQSVSASDNSVEFSFAKDGLSVIEINDQSVGGGILPVAIDDGQGGTIIAWEDHRRGLARYAIFAQRIDAQGNRLWGETGRRVADFPYDQNDPKICSDGNGGAIIAWKGLTDDDVYDIYMQRLNPNGGRVWGEEGIQVTDHYDEDESVEAIIDDGEGGAVVVWLNKSWTTDDDIWAQRINSQGEKVWDEEGLIIVNEVLKQRNARLVRHQNGFVVVWVDGRDDHEGQPQNDIFGQFINPDGSFRWERNGTALNWFEHHQENPSVTIDNSGYIWVVWEDQRGAGTLAARDIYVQKVSPMADPRGRPRLMFEDNGRVVCGAPRDQVEPNIIHDGRDGIWVTWEDYREGVWSEIYATHLRPDGTPFAGWDGDGNLVCAGYHKQNTPQLALLNASGDNGVMLVWEDKRATGKEELSDVFIQKLNDGQVSVDRVDTPIAPVEFTIESVHPNPFNSQALVSFVTRSEGNAKLAIYDLTGRFVKDINSGWWSAGRHIAVVDGTDLPAGIYVVRLQVGNVSVERSLNLVK